MWSIFVDGGNEGIYEYKFSWPTIAAKFLKKMQRQGYRAWGQRNFL